jgi:hypothetical protein
VLHYLPRIKASLDRHCLDYSTRLVRSVIVEVWPRKRGRSFRHEAEKAPAMNLAGPVVALVACWMFMLLFALVFLSLSDSFSRIHSSNISSL